MQTRKLDAMDKVWVREQLWKAGYYAAVTGGTVGKDWSGDRCVWAETNMGDFEINLETGIVKYIE